MDERGLVDLDGWMNRAGGDEVGGWDGMEEKGGCVGACALAGSSRLPVWCCSSSKC